MHRAELAEENAASNVLFANGHAVGEIACALVDDGVMVEAIPDLQAALAATERLISSADRPIFEATFAHDDVLVRVDVLEHDGGAWSVAEVKSATRVKDYHLSDLATQVWVLRECGLNIRSAAIRHIDSAFVLKREGDYHGLFRDADCLEALEPIIAGRQALIADARNVLAGPEPVIDVGDHCTSPFACEFASYCNRASPPDPEWPVTVLPNGGGKSWLAEGVTDLTEIASDQLTNEKQRRVHHATMTGELFHDVDEARRMTASWAWPRTYLDFETIAFVIPRWIGTRPYQQIPFQFSMHVEHADGRIAHTEFLSLDGEDPRRACAEALIAMTPEEGAIIGYNASFERSRILELAAAFGDLRERLNQIASRIVDLLPVTRACWYHRDQRGSWSIKSVLPTVAPELSYASLEIGDGGQAQVAYLEAIGDVNEQRRAALDSALRAYCQRDTYAMVALMRRLCGSSGSPSP